MKIFEENREQLNQICRQHHVERIFVFGSVLTDNFNDESDIDLLVKFEEMDLYNYFDNLLNLKESLQSLFNRKVDILEEQALKNPYLRKSIDKSKKLVYGKPTTEMVV